MQHLEVHCLLPNYLTPPVTAEKFAWFHCLETMQVQALLCQTLLYLSQLTDIPSSKIQQLFEVRIWWLIFHVVPNVQIVVQCTFRLEIPAI